MYASLLNILTWKLYKESLTAYDSFPHPDEQSTRLGSIAFHREGCSTACPGDSVYAIRDLIRFQVQENLNQCFNTGINDLNKSALRWYPNPASDKISLTGYEGIRSISIINQEGKIEAHFEPAESLDLNLQTGVYLMRFESSEGLIWYDKLIILN